MRQKLAEKKAELAKKRAEKEKADKETTDKAKKAVELTDKQKARAERKLAEKKAAEKKAAEAKKTETAKTSKPTPEQILNSGSIEKARQEANKGAAKEVKKAEADKSSAKAEAKTAEGGKKVILQMGSYADRNSADAQRAKLAMLGISSKVVERTNGDKTVYRVQSNSMSSEAAKNVQKDLQKHNINSLMRSAQ